MTTDLHAKATRFRALHEGPEPLLLPNPWDVGTARLLAHLGFEALATTSLGVATSRGRRRATREDVLENTRTIADATSLPVNADLEDGFGASPDAAAKMIADACAHGAVGGSIEDAALEGPAPIYDFELAVERVAAAVEAARALPVPFTLTARAENFLYGRRDLDDTIRRLQAFEAVGADVLYAPGLRTLEEIRAVTAAVTKPVNVVMGFADPTITLDDLAEAGVRRISIGGALCRLALAAFLDGARAMQQGDFRFVERATPMGYVHAAFPEA